MKRPFFTPLFFGICISVVILCVGFMLKPNKENAQTAYVYKNNSLIYELDLNKDREVKISGKYALTVTVKDGEVYISESSCPCKTCEKFGKLSKAGQTAVCLPSNLRIELDGEGEIDALL